MSRAMEYANGDLAFAAWLMIIDNHLKSKIGVSIFDLDDNMWRDEYDDGTHPIAALEAFLEDEYPEAFDLLMAMGDP